MKLLLARHGNTFSEEMTPVFVGSKEDLPLVEEGYHQAARYADFVKAEQLTITRALCGPLQRTRQFAETILRCSNLSLTLTIEPRLDEIDYGSWGGLTNEEVCAKFGQKALQDWNERSVWPSEGQWTPLESELESQTRSLVHELLLSDRNREKNSDNDNDESRENHKDCILLVTSNGRLRYFLKLVPEEFARAREQKSLKVLPGNACLLSFANDTVEVQYWNKSPLKVLQTITS